MWTSSMSENVFSLYLIFQYLSRCVDASDISNVNILINADLTNVFLLSYSIQALSRKVKASAALQYAKQSAE